MKIPIISLAATIFSLAAVAADDSCVSRTVAGSPVTFSGDGGQARAAQLKTPVGLAIDGLGTIYVADTGNHRIRKIRVDGIISTIAGTGEHGFAGDGGPASSAVLFNPSGLAIDAKRNLYISDTDNHRVRKITQDGRITTIAGNGVAGFNGDGLPAAGAALRSPTGLALDAAGNLYVADSGNGRVRKVDQNGIITTVAGNGQQGFGGDGGQATGASLDYPHGLAVDQHGNLYIADENNDRIRKVNAAGIIQTFAGREIEDSYNSATPNGDGGPATAALLWRPRGVAVEPNGSVLISESGAIRKVTPDGIIHTAVKEVSVSALAFDPNGKLHFSSYSGTISRLESNGSSLLIAGISDWGFSGDAGPATAAQLASPSGVAVDRAGNIYIADSFNNRIRMVTVDGRIRTVAGNGIAGYAGDNGPAIEASLNGPAAVAMDSAGNLYIADTGNYRVRRVTPTGMISTIAGTGRPREEYTGVTGLGTGIDINMPTGLAVDGVGNLYIAERGLSHVSPDGTLQEVPFVCAPGPSESVVRALAIDSKDNLYMAVGYYDHDAVCKMNPQGTFSEVRGTSGLLEQIGGLAVDGAGNLYVSEGLTFRVRKITADGVFTTLAGVGYWGRNDASAGPEQPANKLGLLFPAGLAVSSSGDLLIADTGNNRIREVLEAQACPLEIAPHTTWRGTGNAASLYYGIISPGEVISIRGANLGPREPVNAVAENGRLGTLLGGTRVLIDGVPAPLISVQAENITAVVPYSVAQNVSVPFEIESNGVRSGLLYYLNASETHVGLFTANGTGSGQGAILNENGSLNSGSNPAARGSVISLYATGAGETEPPGVDGELARDPLPKPKAKLVAKIGGQPAEIVYAGAAPGLVNGYLQVNVRVPLTLQPGSAIPITLDAENAEPDSTHVGVIIALN